MDLKKKLRPILKKIYYRLLEKRLVPEKLDSILRIISTSKTADAAILDQYVKVRPAPQNALDIFKDEWSSKFPDNAGLSAGAVPLFEDGRVEWAINFLGSMESRKVLELGPLEAYHTFNLERMGAGSVVAVEANTRAYLKCLIIKEIFELKRSHFLLGDFVEFLKNTQEKFDLCFASGVFYHMQDPAELIHLMSRVSDKVYIWTHFYDEDVIKANFVLSLKFKEHKTEDYKGFRHGLHVQHYKSALAWAGFCGGGNATSCWMTKDDIIACLKFFGFNKIDIGHETLDNPNGPYMSIAASK